MSEFGVVLLCVALFCGGALAGAWLAAVLYFEPVLRALRAELDRIKKRDVPDW